MKMTKLQIRMLIFTGLIVGLGYVIWKFDRLAPLNLTTKTCLITGASSGIGKHLSIEMVKRGWKVIGIARRTEELNKLCQDLGENMFIPFVCDVSNIERIHVISDAIKKQGLKPTLFFLNAGTAEISEKWKVSTASHQRTFAVNYFGALAWIEEWLLFVKQLGGGTFIATSSVAALLAMPGCDGYAASKRAILHCFDAFRRQYITDNIGFSVVLPGPVDTDMLIDEAARRLPFRHQPDEEAKYIIDEVFAGKKLIEPSWFYSITLRLINFLPDAFIKNKFGK